MFECLKMIALAGLLPACFPATLCHADKKGDPDRPNILFLISDDLNDYLGSYGDPRAVTPNLDRLADEGVRFDRAYCTFPLCGPSRNSMLTGLYPNSTGIFNNSQIFRQTIPNQPSLSQLFRQNGYFAARLGKLYHYNVPRSVGTNGHDDPASWELEINPAGVDILEEEPSIFSMIPGRFGAVLSWYASPHADEEHTDGMLATEADWVLERCARRPERPFFLAVGFYRPHTPYVAPENPYFGYYPEEAMPLFPISAEDQADLPEAALMSRRSFEDRLTDDLRRKAVQAYYASISFMDAQVGRVLESLERHGLAENTIIVFTSDHGYHMGEHGLWQKRSLFEESTRVPLLMVVPGMKGGQVVPAPVSQIDLFPTLTELCGLQAPANLQGQSLVPMLKDPAAPGRGWALTQVYRVEKGEPFFGYSIRTPRWRYSEWDEGRRGVELYDHESDPGEFINLAGDPEHARVVSDLSARLRAAVRLSQPSAPLPEVERTWGPRLFLP